MNIEQFRTYCIEKKGVSEGFPFDDKTLVFKVMGKMFALCGLEHFPARVNLKCDPDRAIELREEYDGDIIAGYHMNKQQWNTVTLEAVPTELLRELIDHSYELIINKFTKKLRAEYDAL